MSTDSTAPRTRRRMVHISVEKALRKLETEHPNPGICEVDGLISKATCNRVLANANGKYKHLFTRSLVGSGTKSPRRTCYSLRVDFHDKDISDILLTCCNHLNLDVRLAEMVQIVRYRHGEFSLAHHDAGEIDEDLPRENPVFMSSHPSDIRAITAFVYLNDVQHSGHTVFPYMGLHVKPTAGKVLIFSNISVSDGGRTCAVRREMIHSAQPVENCEKFGMNIWFKAQHIVKYDL